MEQLTAAAKWVDRPLQTSDEPGTFRFKGGSFERPVEIEVRCPCGCERVLVGVLRLPPRENLPGWNLRPGRATLSGPVTLFDAAENNGFPRVKAALKQGVWLAAPRSQGLPLGGETFATSGRNWASRRRLATTEPGREKKSPRKTRPSATTAPA